MNRNLLFVVMALSLSFSTAMAQVPTAPTNLTVSSVRATQFVANWSPVTGATSYRIDVSTTSNFSSGNILLNAVTASFSSQVVMGTLPGTTYFFRVRAVNASGTSPNSSIRSLVTAPVAPIINGANEIGPDYLSIIWKASQGATDYRVDVSLTNTFSNFVFQNLDARTTSIIINNLQPLNTYFIRVRALNTLGTSDNSDTFSVKTDQPHRIPTVAAATNITSTSFVAHWFPNGPTTRVTYLVAASTDSTFKSATFTNTVKNDTSLMITVAPSKLPYYFKVLGSNTFGASDYSRISEPVFLLNQPAAPTVLPPTGITSRSFIAHWTASGPFDFTTSYQLQVSTDSLFATDVFTYNVLRDTMQIVTPNSPQANRPYFYRVRVQNNNGVSDFSRRSVAVFLVPVLAPIVLPPTGITSTSFIANWTANGPVDFTTSYQLQVSTDSLFVTDVFTYNVLRDTMQIVTPNSPQASRPYFYRVRVQNNNGVSDFSRRSVAVFLVPVLAPIILPPTNITSTSFIAHWTARGPFDFTTSYQLQVSTDSLFATDVFTYNILRDTMQIVTPNSPQASRPYFYRVRVQNNNGVSDFSRRSAVFLLPAAPTPTILPPTNITSTSFTAHWRANGPLTGITFHVQISQDSLFSSGVLSFKVVGDTSFNFVTMSGGSYFYRVQAESSVGFSDFSMRSILINLIGTNMAGNLYPNPVKSSEVLTVDLKDFAPLNNVVVTITSATGDKSIQYNFQSEYDGKLNARIPVSALQPGTYILKAGQNSIRFVVR